MKNKFSFPVNINRIDRKTASFTLSSAIIATMFLIALVGIFTGKFRPFASQVSINPPSQPVADTHVPIPPASLQFDYSDGVRGTAQSNTVNVNLGAIPKGIIALQGITRTEDTDKNLSVSGKVAVRDANNQLIATPADWSSDSFEDTKKMGTLFNNGSVLDALDTKDEAAELTYTIKPQYYLAVSAKAKAGESTVTFPQAPVGDVNNEGNGDNRIDEADFAVWSAQFDQSTNAGNTHLDFNKDGRIDEADFALAFTDNFNKTGDPVN